MPKYRSATTTHGRNMAGARALWRATGMTDADFGKPIIAVVNSFTQFVPGHVHLRDLGKLVAEQIEASGGVAKEFNTIAVDDGIAMGHGGMLYSLPSRELIADSVEYMVNAHCADAMVCISNCDKITPGMLMASLRLNIPVIFVSGGPMEAGKTKLSDKIIKLDLVDAMIQGADPKVSDEQSDQVERSACPTCGSCSGMFTANSMNCLTEALGLSQPGNGSLLATHADRKQLFLNAGKRIVELTKRYYEQDDASALPRNIASKAAFENAMKLDVAMGGSTNTVLHLLAAAQEAAKHMIELVGGKGTVGVICHDQTSQTGKQRCNGFVDYVKANAADINLLEPQVAGEVEDEVQLLEEATQVPSFVVAVRWAMVALREEPSGSFGRGGIQIVPLGRGRPQLVDRGFGLLALGRMAGGTPDQLPGDLQHPLARFGDRGEPLATALEDDNPQFVLQQLDLFGHTRLRGIQHLGGFGDVESATRHLNQITQLL